MTPPRKCARLTRNREAQQELGRGANEERRGDRCTAGISVPPCPPIGWSGRARPREQAKLAGGAEDEEHPHVTEAQFWNLRDQIDIGN